MCRKHLLGEHVEIHMLAGTLTKGNSIKGFLDKGLLMPQAMQSRHQALVEEMNKRGYTHKSPLPEVIHSIVGVVNVMKSTLELRRRCPECLARMGQ
jgi:hypothetical protein